jgi:hypothetical protein
MRVDKSVRMTVVMRMIMVVCVVVTMVMAIVAVMGMRIGHADRPVKRGRDDTTNQIQTKSGLHKKRPGSPGLFPQTTLRNR